MFERVPEFKTVSVGTPLLVEAYNELAIIPGTAVGASVTITNSAQQTLSISGPTVLGSKSGGWDNWGPLTLTALVADAQIIINGDVLVTGSTGTGGGGGGAIWGMITGNINNQTDLFATFIPYAGQNYRVVKASGDAVANGTALLAAFSAAQSLTPNGVALSNTNRAVVYLLAGTYNIGAFDLKLFEFVDVIGIGAAQDIVVTGVADGVFSAQATNNYVLKNLSITNTAAGGSISHAIPVGTDNGVWDNLILNSPNTESTIFAGTYNNITGTVDHIFNGDITGTVSNSTFTNNSCGFTATGDVTISGTIYNCKANSFSFGRTENGNLTISGTIDNCVSTNASSGSFGLASGGDCILSGIISNCKSGRASFINGSVSAQITSTGIMDNCSIPFDPVTGGSFSFVHSSFGTVTMAGTIRNCQTNISGTTLRAFCASGTGVITISGTIQNCISNGSHCFGASDGSSNITISGTIIDCECPTNSFGFSSSGTMTVSGTIENCNGGTNSFGSTTSAGKLINCVRTSSLGVHLGKIDRCTFSDNDASNASLTIGASAIVKYSTIYQQGVGECIDAGSAISASVYLCSMNKALGSNVTNSIGTPNNVVDSNIIV